MVARAGERRSARFGHQASGRLARVLVLAALPLSLSALPAAPAAAAPPAVTDGNASAAVATPPASVPGRAAGRALVRVPLPSYFTVELWAEGVIVADGVRLGAPTELERVAREAVSRGELAGAIVFGDGARPASELAQVAALLERAGFTSVRSVARSAPLELSAFARAEEARADKARQRLVAAGVIEGDPVVAAKPGTAPAPSAPPQRTVALQSMGLHLSAEANREPYRRQLLKLFERNFGAFRRCHAEVPEHAENASFGVDLLIPAAGGRAKVRETRTRLAGDGFKTCMLRTFQSIRFEPPPTARPEIVSYSVVFKPVRSEAKLP